MVRNFEKTFITDDRYKFFINGLGNTLKIAALAVILGIIIGVIVAVVKVNATEKHSKIKWLNKIFTVYIAIIRGTPVVVQLMIMYYIILKNVESTIVVAVLAFGINSGAYVAEIVRAGIMAVDRGQMEAGRSLGLTRLQTMLHIILPQAVKNILPALGNEFITVIKETSIAGYIPIIDLTKAGDIVRSRTYEPFFALIIVAVIYFIVVWILTLGLRALERRLARSDRR
ncbi:MAG TPA: amino acid ABC transporter permease [Oscillospiraceae bacterium]|nr:amino acid ABC transporter permease [Oscillospiraceae bacterium]HPF55433.1 amino acid ABC transporter permease [Clostridiales bacterium]HPK36252.1 amino acid ABC transporter permease [Oscillospiraceae bacterium]HPR75480.1 amino acid ABC transporter permease [Oscillospiraceae bacterium]